MSRREPRKESDLWDLVFLVLFVQGIALILIAVYAREWLAALVFVGLLVATMRVDSIVVRARRRRLR